MGSLVVRRLEPREWEGIFPLVALLRPHLDKDEFLRRVRRQSHGGYELVGAFNVVAWSELSACGRCTRWCGARICISTTSWWPMTCASQAWAGR
jgi:hypothetical protein